MPEPHLNLQKLNSENFKNITAGLGNLITQRGLNQQAMNALMTNAKNLLEFLKKPSESGNEVVNAQGD